MKTLLSLLTGLQALRAADHRRTGVPGEHWAVFGSAITTLAAARSLRSPLLRAAVSTVGIALAARALSGRDGAVTRLLQRLRGTGIRSRRTA